MRFVIYRDRRKEWRWRIVAKNGKVIADSAEGYKRKSHARKMVSRIIMGPHRIVEEEDDSHSRR